MDRGNDNRYDTLETAAIMHVTTQESRRDDSCDGFRF
jgi:hypothetical protein